MFLQERFAKILKYLIPDKNLESVFFYGYKYKLKILLN